MGMQSYCFDLCILSVPFVFVQLLHANSLLYNVLIQVYGDLQPHV